MIVAERSASVSTQIRSPALVVYAERMRNPCSTDTSFSCLSASGTSPQSPLNAGPETLPGAALPSLRHGAPHVLPPPDLTQSVSLVLLWIAFAPPVCSVRSITHALDS